MAIDQMAICGWPLWTNPYNMHPQIRGDASGEVGEVDLPVYFLTYNDLQELGFAWLQKNWTQIS